MAPVRALLAAAVIIGLAWGAVAAPPAASAGLKLPVGAAPACNTQQRNLGGDVLVLDIDSFTDPRMGTRYTPETCCKACQELDGCNAWVACTKKDGCGSGCTAYVKANKGPDVYGAPLPIKGLFALKNCLGDRWPANMCSLKFIKDVKNPPVTPNGAAEGWVSGVVPKPTNLDKRCAPGTSAKTCSTCLSTKNPAVCLSCQATAGRLNSLRECAGCANFTDAAAAATCLKCVAPGKGKPAERCANCMDANDGYQQPKLPSAQACFACIGKSTSQEAKDSCGTCFYTPTWTPADQESCSVCVGRSTSPTGASTCVACYAQAIKDKAGCVACAAKAKTQAQAAVCSGCVNTDYVFPEYAGKCRECAAAATGDAQSYCWNQFTSAPPSPKHAAALDTFHACLAKAKGDRSAAMSCQDTYYATMRGW